MAAKIFLLSLSIDVYAQVEHCVPVCHCIAEANNCVITITKEMENRMAQNEDSGVGLQRIVMNYTHTYMHNLFYPGQVFGSKKLTWTC